MVSRLILNAIAEVAGIDGRVDPGLVEGESVLRDGVEYDDPLEALSEGHVGHVVVGSDGTQTADRGFSGGVLPGRSIRFIGVMLVWSRRPRQDSARLWPTKSRSRTSTRPPLELEEVRRRVSQFAGMSDVVVTRTPVFYEKAKLLPGCTFVIGVDTMRRVIDPKYYDGSKEKMLTAIHGMRELGSSFLVAGRVDGREFKTLRDVEVPSEMEGMFREIPESEFREDLSSTGIRLASESVGVQ